MINEEIRIIARGLNPNAALLLVKRKISGFRGRMIRVIVSAEDAAVEVMAFFEKNGAVTELDKAGIDYHVIADMTNFKDVD